MIEFKKTTSFVLVLFLSICILSCSKGDKKMIYESDLYSIEYDKKSEKLVQTINEALSQNFQRVIDFWGIEKLDNHVKIKIY